MNKHRFIAAFSKVSLAVLLFAALTIVGNPAKIVDAATLTVKSDEYPIDSSLLASKLDTQGGAFMLYSDVMSLVKSGNGKYTYVDNSGNSKTGTITPSMCTIYNPDGTLYDTITEKGLYAGVSYTLHIQYGTDSTTGVDRTFTVTTVSRIDWPTSLPTTQYLAGTDWDTDGAVIKVTYADGFIKTVPVTPNMLYLAETVKSTGGVSKDNEGDVIGYQDSNYDDGFKNRINNYRLVLRWDKYNSASNYTDYSLSSITASPAGDNSTQALYVLQRKTTADPNCTRAYAEDAVDFLFFEAFNIPMNGMEKIASNAIKFYDVTVSAASEYLPEIKYSAHVQNIGWQGFYYSPNTAGTTGQSKRMEAIVFDIENLKSGFGGVSYQVHVQNKGWMDTVTTGQVAGTTGESLRMEAIRINLTGQYAQRYDIQYRVHVQTTGWSEWSSNGETAGTTGISKRLEAIEVRVVAKQ